MKHVRDFSVKYIAEPNLDDIEILISNIHRHEYILKDIKQYIEAERDRVNPLAFFNLFIFDP